MHPPSSASALSDLAEATRLRADMATALQQMATTLEQGEQAAALASGQLGLNHEIQSLTRASQQLQLGVFRLLVLGDMKRGKSTLINALLGERVLPMDASPCTAVPTVLKYGSEKRVTVHFSNDRQPEVLDLASFAQTYTIPADEAKRLEDQQQVAFAGVSHAVVEYPLALLESGVEIIDTPGLNDTQARNHTTLEYLLSCHAVLFVMSATQPCTLDERRYLQNYLRGRGLTLFFLVNGWDLISTSLPDPEDKAALAAAETKIQQVFAAQLTPYCQVGTQNCYPQRVFTLSALAALRQRLADPSADLSGTGFGTFVQALTQFLSQDRLGAELTWAERLAQRSYAQVSEAIGRRIPLLTDDAAELRDKIAAVQQEFAQLAAIRDQYQALIRQAAARVGQSMAADFKRYLLNLETTFEADFAESQPDLSLLEFLDEQNRAQFFASFKRAFERYLNDRLAAWEYLARQTLAQEFDQLSQQAQTHRSDYAQVINTINQKLLGSSFSATTPYRSVAATPWTDGVREMILGIPDVFNATAASFSYFWQPVFQFALAYFFLYLFRYVFFVLIYGIAPTLMMSVFTGMGLVAVQAEVVRQTFLEKTKQAFAKLLPEQAEQQAPLVVQALQRCFDTYETTIMAQINDDILARRAELDNLLTQKEAHQVDAAAEVARLKTLEVELTDTLAQIAQVQPAS
jgi:GTPase SAR1 family protein